MANQIPTLPLAAGINTFRIVGQTNNSDMIKKLVPLAGTGEGNFTLNKLVQYFLSFVNGAYRSNIYVTTNLAYASDLVTFSGTVNGNTIVVNGRTYTAETSGATGLQQFNIGGSDTNAAKNFAAILNADTSTAVKGVVLAIASGATVTLFCLVPGNIGLQMTASATGPTVATANFTGGTEGSSGTEGHGL